MPEILSDSADAIRSREVRLGLVMYGGVSLAVYINGVAQEFFRAVRGRGVYRLVKALTDSDIVVDIISGTSAGGVNGILLGYALTNDKDFVACSSLWRRDGDIQRLLRSPEFSVDCQSLLDSEGFYQPKLEAAFREMPAYVPEPGEERSEIKELDLFVTGTDVDGRVYTEFDEKGHAIDVKDHRAVFLLKHRAGRKNQLRPDPNNPETLFRALAKMARITSCFPAAFAPVHIAREAPGEQSPDALLQYWGGLKREAWFLDGGVLDNKPFTHTIRQIFGRTAERNVLRMLFYVEPDPERFDKNHPVTRPTILRATMDSMMGIPGYESIADDLDLIAQHNSRIQQYNDLAGDLELVLLDNLPARVLDLLSRIEAGESELVWGIPGQMPEPTRTLYLRSRRAVLRDRALDGVLKTDGERVHLREPREREAAAALVDAFNQIVDADPAMLRDFDIDFRQRRLFHAVQAIKQRIRDAADPPEPESAAALGGLLAAFNWQIKRFEIVDAAVDDLLGRASFDWQSAGAAPLALWRQVAAALLGLLADGGAPLPGDEQGELSRFHQSLRARADEILRAMAGGPIEPPADGGNLLLACDRLERDTLARFAAQDPNGEVASIQRLYNLFPVIDAHLFPVERASGIREKDVIRTVRISPYDAQRGFSRRSLADKVCGDAVSHFGAFFKRSWRSNDILWGRLDGVCQLLECLLEPGRVAAIVANAATRQRLAGAFDPATLFPHSDQDARARIGAWLDNLLDPEPAVRARALDGDEFDASLERLIEAAQLEILHEELPQVLSDAIEEQAEWNQFRVPAERRLRQVGAADDVVRVDPGTTTFLPGSGSLDRLVVTVAAEQQARRALDHIEAPPPGSPPGSSLGRFFRERYRVGQESLLNDVPHLVLLEILATALLVLRNCVLTLLGKRAGAVAAHPLYRFGLDYPLRAFRGMVLLLRRAPERAGSVLAGTGVLAAVLLAIGVTWRKEILFAGGDLSYTWFGVFILAPLVVLVAEGLFLVDGFARRWRWRRLVRGVAIAVLIVAPLAAIGPYLAGKAKGGPLDGLWALMAQAGLPEHWAARAAFLAFCLLSFLAPLIGGWLAARPEKSERLTVAE
jgi:patatin-related protein